MAKVQQSLKESSARATLPGAGPKRSSMVLQTQQIAEVVKAAPDYSRNPEVQKTLKAWLLAATTVDQAEQDLKAAHLRVSALVASQAKLVAGWKRAKRFVLAAIDTASDGSAAAIKQWGFGVHSSAPLAKTSDPPLGLRAAYTKDLVLQLRWRSVKGQRGYLLQLGDGTPQGWGVAVPCTKTIHVPTGLSPGQKVAFRVAVLRKDGQSAWSDALAVSVR